MTEMYSEDVPSRRLTLLRKLLGQRIAKLIHFSWSPVQEISDYHEISKDDVFSFSDGPFVLAVESGLALGFGTQDSLNSITVWTERTEAGERCDGCAEDDQEMLPISGADESFARPFWGRLVGRVITGVTVYTREMVDPRYEALPNEAAVAIATDNGSTFILGHNLLNVSEDFLALELDQIPQSVMTQLVVLHALDGKPD